MVGRASSRDRRLTRTLFSSVPDVDQMRTGPTPIRWRMTLGPSQARSL